jgi:polyphosphate kinase 2 (PPK2 family)
VLTALQLDQPMGKAAYERALAQWQGRLNLRLARPALQALSVVAVFEGNDGAGKGGAIRRVTGALDARQYANIPVAAPTEEERAQPYLWRFWRRLPRRGRFAFFDRSWYGRVLVERVEGFCSEADWMRAYGEINDFEHSLRQHGVVLVKFWLAVTQGRATAPLQAARDGRVQALQDHCRRLAQPREVGRLRSRRLRHGRPHLDRRRPPGRWWKRTTSTTRASRC